MLSIKLPGACVTLMLIASWAYCQPNSPVAYVYGVSFSTRKYEKMSLGKLYFNDTASLFVYNKLGDLDPNEQKSALFSSDTGVVMWSSIKDEQGQQVFRDYRSHKIITRETGSKLMPPFIVNDDWQVIHWKIDGERKTIDTFVCEKATGYFRGRIYVAWFTRSIPTVAGPWKLSGLPGLIIEAEDMEHLFSFKLIGQETDSTPVQAPHESGVKSLKEYVYYLDNYLLFVEKRMQETLPKGISATLNNPPSPKTIKEERDKKIERVYEWEKDKRIPAGNQFQLAD